MIEKNTTWIRHREQIARQCDGASRNDGAPLSKAFLDALICVLPYVANLALQIDRERFFRLVEHGGALSAVFMLFEANVAYMLSDDARGSVVATVHVPPFVPETSFRSDCATTALIGALATGLVDASRELPCSLNHHSLNSMH